MLTRRYGSLYGDGITALIVSIRFVCAVFHGDGIRADFSNSKVGDFIPVFVKMLFAYCTIFVSFRSEIFRCRRDFVYPLAKLMLHQINIYLTILHSKCCVGKSGGIFYFTLSVQVAALITVPVAVIVSLSICALSCLQTLSALQILSLVQVYIASPQSWICTLDCFL